MKTLIHVLFIIVIFYSQTLLATHENTTTQVTGAYPFGPGSVVVHDPARDVYFVASGAGVLVMDFSQLNSPVVVNESITMTSQIGDIEFDAAKNLLYVAAHDFYVWDVSDINNPVNVSVLTHETAASPNFSVHKLSMEGNIIFSTSGLSVHAIDVMDPANPILKATYTEFDPGGGGLRPIFNGVASKGNFVFVTGTGVDMRIYEYSDSTGFSYIHTTSWSVNTSRSPVVYGNYLFYYSSSFGTGLAVMDVTSRDTFSTFSTPVYPEYSEVFSISGTTAFVGSNLSGVSTAELNLIDITDPLNFSTPLSTMPFGSLVQAVAASNTQFAIITKYDDLQVMNYTNSSAPTLASTFVVDGVTTRINLEGTLALLSQPYAGVHLVDVSDPTKPVRKSTIRPVEFAMGGVTQGNVAYILDKRLIRLFDVTDISAPVLVGQYKLTPQIASESSLASAIAVSGNIAVASVLTDVEVLNVSQVDRSVLLGRYTTRDWVRNIRIYGNHVYISTGAGLEIVDISNPSTPKEVGFFAIRFNQDSIKQGDYIYAVSALDGFYVLDASNVTKITQVGFNNVIGTINALAVNGNYALVANTYNGARLFDISDATNPIPVGIFEDKNIRGLAPLANNFLAAGNYVGMKTIKNLLDDGIGGNPPPGPDPVPNQAPVADAGYDQTVTSRSTVTLNGTASYDPDGDNISYQWTQISGNSVSISNANSSTPSFRAPRVKRQDKVMVFELTVTDTAGLQSTDSVTITAVR